jgi:preprotein translocase subunit SecG
MDRTTVFGTVSRGSIPLGGTNHFSLILFNSIIVKFMNYPIAILQIIICILLAIVILLQPKSGGLGRAFGGNSINYTRRGFEKVLFNFTIILAVAFVLTSVANFLV